MGAIQIKCIFVFGSFSWIYLDSIIFGVLGKEFVIKAIGLI